MNNCDYFYLHKSSAYPYSSKSSAYTYSSIAVGISVNLYNGSNSYASSIDWKECLRLGLEYSMLCNKRGLIHEQTSMEEIP